jgi:hypothetical protein
VHSVVVSEQLKAAVFADAKMTVVFEMLIVTVVVKNTVVVVLVVVAAAVFADAAAAAVVAVAADVVAAASSVFDAPGIVPLEEPRVVAVVSADVADVVDDFLVTLIATASHLGFRMTRVDSREEDEKGVQKQGSVDE